jgi:hypothetical protein
MSKTCGDRTRFESANPIWRVSRMTASLRHYVAVAEACECGMGWGRFHVREPRWGEYLFIARTVQLTHNGQGIC